MGRRRRASNDAALLFLAFAILVAIIGGLFKLIAAIARGFSAGATDKQRQDAKALLGVTVAGAVVLVIVAVSASTSSNTSSASTSASYSPPSPAPPTNAQLGALALAQASSCIDAADWSCAQTSLDEAERHQTSTQELRDKAAAAILQEAQSFYDTAKTAPKSDRLGLLQHAGASVAFVQAIAPRSESAIPASRLEKSIQSKLPHAPATKPVAKRSVTRPVQPASFEQPDVDAPALELTPSAQEGRACCKICSTGYACGNSCISRGKSCHKGRGCACDG